MSVTVLNSSLKDNNLTGQRTISRRSFIAGTAVAAPMILSSGVLAANGRPGANDRIVTGHIGVGGKGSSHLKSIPENVGALCDVDSIQVEKAATLLDRKVPIYSDYRHLLERKDIDAVVIASPDHWHALMMIHACQAGKDVYVEKPACKYIEEGRAMVNAAKKYKRVVQVGSQGRNHPGAETLRKFLQDGMIGRVTRVECWHNDNPVGGDPLKTGNPPANLDWDMWLGPAQGRPFNPDYCHKNFRWILDLGGGQIRDRGAHVFNLVSWFLDLDRTGPSEITASGKRPTEGIWNCPTNFKVSYEYKKPNLTIEWSQPGVRAADFEFGAVYHGTKGKTIVRGGDGRVFLDEQVEAYAQANNLEYTLPKGVPAHSLNLQNWFDCIKTRKTPIMDIESGHRVASMCILANLAYRLERPIEWNARRERFDKDKAANLLLGSPGRGKYHI
ncbi:MAG: Gfo/Idh/MocA family oxidoreductase [Verrucomicrobia bacterium]|nr:Gfo/Idh/MocA family oxidoreductase [Verrucomicrobiota bacterium]